MQENSRYIDRPYLCGSSHKIKKLPLWPVVLLCFFSISTGSVKLFGLPQVFILPLLVVIYMFVISGMKLNIAGFLFIIALLIGYLPGTIVSQVENTFEVRSFINLLASLAMFVITFDYIVKLLRCDTRKVLNQIEFLLTIFIFLSIIEIFFYNEIFSIREYYYRGMIENQFNRDVLIYGFPRPTGFFTEPSNFARFLSILLTMHLLLSSTMRKSFILFCVFVALVRSPNLFFAVPLVLVIYLQKQSVKDTIILMLVVTILLGVFLLFNQDRVVSVLQGSDGSFSARIILPIDYMLNSWKNPFLGSGPTPINNISNYVNPIFIGNGRDWLIGVDDFRIGFSSTLVVIVGMGLIGLFLFFVCCYIFFKKDGVWMFFIFFTANILSAGANSASMYVPIVFLLAFYYFLRKDRYTSSLLFYQVRV